MVQVAEQVTDRAAGFCIEPRFDRQFTRDHRHTLPNFSTRTSDVGRRFRSIRYCSSVTVPLSTIRTDNAPGKLLNNCAIGGRPTAPSSVIVTPATFSVDEPSCSICKLSTR